MVEDGFAQSRPVAPASAPTAASGTFAGDKKTAAAIAAAAIERIMRNLRLGSGRGRRLFAAVVLDFERPQATIDLDQVDEDLLDLLQEHVEAGERSARLAPDARQMETLARLLLDLRKCHDAGIIGGAGIVDEPFDPPRRPVLENVVGIVIGGVVPVDVGGEVD